MKDKKRRKSLKKEFIKVTVEGKKSRMHFIPTETGVQVKLQKKEKNPDKVLLGEVKMGNKTLSFFAYKNQPKLVFIALNDEFIPLNKFKLREVVSSVAKEAWFIGLYGKRAKKYRRNLQR